MGEEGRLSFGPSHQEGGVGHNESVRRPVERYRALRHHDRDGDEGDCVGEESSYRAKYEYHEAHAQRLSFVAHCFSFLV